MNIRYRTELQEFVEAMKREGIDLPTVTEEKYEPRYLWTFQESSNKLDLMSYFGGSFCRVEGMDADPLKESLDNFIREGELERIPYIYYAFGPQDFEDEEEVNPAEWKNLPKRHKENVALIKRLDDYLPNDHNARNLRKLPLTIEDSEEYVKRHNNFEELYVRSEDLYSKLISEGGLRWADIMGEEFPYVVTNSDVLKNVGRSVGGLYFVSTDIANEPWKEQLVAWHEKFCDWEDHEFALQKELELAESLGKQKEYEIWRKEIEGNAKKGMYS